MIRKTLFALSLISIATLLIYATKQQEKEYTVTMNLKDWNVALLSINTPDDITTNQKKEVVQKIFSQLQKQLTDSLPKKKN